jgi:hypothetical protein
MRLVLAVLIGVIAGSSADTARADPYRWCFDSAGDNAAGTNCYFITLEQCRASISGIGGFCRPNLFYDGRPEETPEPVQRVKKPPQKSK